MKGAQRTYPVQNRKRSKPVPTKDKSSFMKELIDWITTQKARLMGVLPERMKKTRMKKNGPKPRTCLKM